MSESSLRGVMWVVGSGEYSDQSNHAIFDDEAAAREYADLCNYWVDELPLNPKMATRPAGCFVYRIRMHEDGSYSVNSTEPERVGYNSVLNLVPEKAYGVRRYEYVNGEPRPQVKTQRWETMFHLWARDVEHAAKIAGEKRAGWVIDGTWAKLGWKPAAGWDEESVSDVRGQQVWREGGR